MIQEALDLLLQHESELGDSPAYLWRVCKARYLLAVIAGQVRQYRYSLSTSGEFCYLLAVIVGQVRQYRYSLPTSGELC